MAGDRDVSGLGEGLLETGKGLCLEPLGSPSHLGHALWHWALDQLAGPLLITPASLPSLLHNVGKVMVPAAGGFRHLLMGPFPLDLARMALTL